MFAAERDNARTLWPVRSAALTVSSPMPRLAPMMRIAAITADIGPRRKLTSGSAGLAQREVSPDKGSNLTDVIQTGLENERQGPDGGRSLGHQDEFVDRGLDRHHVVRDWSEDATNRAFA